MNTLPTVVSEGFLTISSDLTIRIVVLSNGQQCIPEEDMKKACEWLGVDLASVEAEKLFGDTE